MSGELDKAKGKIKQATGRLTDDEQMEQEGKLEELAGKAKHAVDTVKEAVKDKVHGKD